jgi:Putative zinc-binding metallo-peptidase
MSVAQIRFDESSPDQWSREREKLLQDKIKDLGLKIEGTYLEPLVGRLYEELERAGIALKPKVYLADEWACPDGVPVIGIPFYLADPRLARIEDEMMDGVEARTEQEISSFLRHEAGHAFNYAYKLYQTEPWRELFGDMSLPYLEEYTPQPFSRNFVRHIPGWYAQKHPDEDFAETFAVWLTPDSNWREVYRGWGCFNKLSYVESIVQQLGHEQPLVTGEDYDFASEEMVYSVADHYQRTRPELAELPAQFDHELLFVFRGEPRAPGRQPAHEFLSRHRRELVNRVAYWTGLYDVQVRSLIAHLIDRTQRLGLGLSPHDSDRVLVDFAVFATTLCMNRLYKGDYVFHHGRDA